jgi:hypothetical protein
MSNLPPSGEIPRGAIRFNTDSNKPELWDGSQWAEFQLSTPNLGRSVDTQPGARGLFGGGQQASPVGEIKSIDYINIASTGNAQDFGDLQQTRASLSSLGSSTRGFWVGGRDAPANYDIIEFVNFGSLGNFTDFGNLSSAKQGPFGLSNATRGIAGGGTFGNTVDYITMASTGTVSTFGTLTPSNLGTYQSACMTPTRGVYHQSLKPSPYAGSIFLGNITIATTGDSTQFGDLSQERANIACLSNSTRGIFAGGYQAPAPNVTSSMEYVELTSEGNAVFFGDLSSEKYNLNGNCTSPTRGVIAGGYAAPNYLNTIEYVQIQSLGDAVDFGDLTGPTLMPSGVSNAHGGL